MAQRVALVTGGARGIGRAVALALARDGRRVAVGDLLEEAASKTAEAIGADALAVPLDVTDSASVAAAVERTEERARTDRRAREQRGLGRGAALHRDRRGLLGPGDRDQLQGRPPGDPRRPAGHGGAPLGTGREHRLGRRPRGLFARVGLLGRQGRRDRVHQDDRARGGPFRRDRERRLPRAHEDRVPRPDRGRGRRAARGCR